MSVRYSNVVSMLIIYIIGSPIYRQTSQTDTSLTHSPFQHTPHSPSRSFYIYSTSSFARRSSLNREHDDVEDWERTLMRIGMMCSRRQRRSVEGIWRGLSGFRRMRAGDEVWLVRLG